MTYAQGRLAITYNGEIYNYQRLRRALEGRGHCFVTASDTEVILAAYAEWGERCVDHLLGMFAFGIWDARTETLVLARDRLGIKPLVYTQSGSLLAFASETKALLAWNDQRPDVDAVAVHQLLTYRYVRGARTMWRGIHRLPPAHIARFHRGHLDLRRYWSPPEPGNGAEAATARQLDELMIEAVRDHLVADVPVSAFVSGGLDSTALLAWSQAAGGSLAHAFCLGFGTPYDECAHAQAAAAAHRMPSHVVRMQPADLVQLPRVLWHLDEPIGDAIAVATDVLARAAGALTKVVLSGEGADEVFAGYIHLRAMSASDLGRSRIGQLALPVLRAAARAAPPPLLQRLFPYPGTLGSSGRRRLIALLDTLDDPVAVYRSLTRVISDAERSRLYTPEFAAAIADYEAEQDAVARSQFASGPAVHAAMRLDLSEWLPNYTLHRLDRLLMAHGVEGRVPYLDHRVVEFALRAPARRLVDPLREKKLLRQAAPRSIRRWARRRKQAFAVPLDQPVFGDAASAIIGGYLRDALVADRGFFRRDALESLTHPRTGDLLRSKQTAAIAIAECWHQVFVDPPSRHGV